MEEPQTINQVFEAIEEVLKKSKEEWQKAVDSEPNPVLKMIMLDTDRLYQIQSYFQHLHLVYGIEARIVFPDVQT